MKTYLIKSFSSFIFIVLLSVFSAFSQTAEITFTKIEYDYGTIKKGDNGECEFIFKNTGKEPLLLTAVRSSCGCTVPDWSSEPIMPGKTGTIKVVYDTKRLGTIDKQVSVISNASNSPVVLRIKGNVSDN